MMPPICSVQYSCCYLSCVLQKLNLPALSVTSDSFVPMLARLDECIAFIQSKVGNVCVRVCMRVCVYGGRDVRACVWYRVSGHLDISMVLFILCVWRVQNQHWTLLYTNSVLQLHYKESQLYLARFMQFQARALNFIKLHVISSLKNTTKSIQASKPVSII